MHKSISMIFIWTGRTLKEPSSIENQLRCLSVVLHPYSPMGKASFHDVLIHLYYNSASITQSLPSYKCNRGSQYPSFLTLVAYKILLTWMWKDEYTYILYIVRVSTHTHTHTHTNTHLLKKFSKPSTCLWPAKGRLWAHALFFIIHHLDFN